MSSTRILKQMLTTNVSQMLIKNCGLGCLCGFDSPGFAAPEHAGMLAFSSAGQSRNW